MCVPQIKNKLQEFKHALPNLISIKNNGWHDTWNHSVVDGHNSFDLNIICVPNFDVLNLSSKCNLLRAWSKKNGWTLKCSIQKQVNWSQENSHGN